MEKMWTFLKNKINEHGESVYRFQCECKMPEDALDIDVEACGENDEKKSITLSLGNIDAGFFERLQHAWKVLTGRWGWREFCVREEDFKNLSEIFDPDKKLSDLP
jgi:hypothetical protein